MGVPMALSGGCVSATVPVPVTRAAADAEKFLRRIAGLSTASTALTREPVHDEMNGEIA